MSAKKKIPGGPGRNPMPDEQKKIGLTVQVPGQFIKKYGSNYAARERLRVLIEADLKE